MEYFIWDMSSILFYAFAGVMAWIVAHKYKSDNPETSYMHPWLLGLAVSFMSGFATGLFCVFSVVLYVSSVQLIESIGKMVKKQ